MYIQMPFIEIRGYRFKTLSRHYAETAFSRMKETAPYKSGRNRGHVQVNGEKITWEKKS